MISPHLDDAIFSVGELLTDGHPTVIACPFAALPPDPRGRRKYQTLKLEHAAACRALNLGCFDGPFLDDAYPDRNLRALRGWLKKATHGAGEIWVPVGIHHPDHLLVSALGLEVLDGRPVVLYEELPYRVLYPEATVARLDSLRAGRVLHLRGGRAALPEKSTAVECYRSQLGGDVIRRCLYVPERTWWAAA